MWLVEIFNFLRWFALEDHAKFLLHSTGMNQSEEKVGNKGLTASRFRILTTRSYYRKNSPCPGHPIPQSDRETLMQRTYIPLVFLLVDKSFKIINRHLLKYIHSFDMTTDKLYKEGVCKKNYQLMAAGIGCGIGEN